jgi:hypothetical protein
MRAGKPSRTAEYMALFRALEHARGPGARLFADPFARAFPPTWTGPSSTTRAPTVSSRRSPPRGSAGPSLDPAGLAGYLAQRGLRLDEDLGAGAYRAQCFGPAPAAMRGYEFYRVASARVTGAPHAGARRPA